MTSALLTYRQKLLRLRRVLRNAQKVIIETRAFLLEREEREQAAMGIEGTIAKWVLEFLVEAAKLGIEAIQARDPAKMRKVRDFIGAPGTPLEAELVAAEEKAKRIRENER